MKTLLLSIVLFVSTSLTTVFAQSDDYQTAMTNALTRFKALPRAAKPTDLLAVANQFERMAGAEPKQWLPAYYAGLMYNLLGFSGDDTDTKDKYLDKADQWTAKADRISPDNDEVHVLLAQIAQARLAASPMFRWINYGATSDEELKKARQLNPDNPRIYLVEGTGLMFKPGMFGGGPKTACPMLIMADQKFAGVKTVSPLHPDWGLVNVKKMLNRCKEVKKQTEPITINNQLP